MNIDNEINLVNLLGYNTEKITDKYYIITNSEKEIKGNIIHDNNLIAIAISDEENETVINGIKNTKYNPEQYFLYVSKHDEVYKMSFDFGNTKSVSLKSLSTSEIVSIKTNEYSFNASISNQEGKKEVMYTINDSDTTDNKFKIYSTNFEQINNNGFISKAEETYFQDDSLFNLTMFFRNEDGNFTKKIVDYDVSKALKINRTGFDIYKEVEYCLSSICSIENLNTFLFDGLPFSSDINLLINDSVKIKVKN